MMELNEFYTKYVEDMAAVRSNQNAHEKRINNIEKDIEDLQKESKAIYEINTNVRLLAEGMSTVRQDIAEQKADTKTVKADITKLKEDITDVQNQPARTKAMWWDKVIWLIAGACISTIVAFLISSL